MQSPSSISSGIAVSLEAQQTSKAPRHFEWETELSKSAREVFPFPSLTSRLGSLHSNKGTQSQGVSGGRVVVLTEEGVTPEDPEEPLVSLGRVQQMSSISGQLSTLVTGPELFPKEVLMSMIPTPDVVMTPSTHW